jgi:hypothetical protein
VSVTSGERDAMWAAPRRSARPQIQQPAPRHEQLMECIDIR